MVDGFLMMADERILDLFLDVYGRTKDGLEKGQEEHNNRKQKGKEKLAGSRIFKNLDAANFCSRGLSLGDVLSARLPLFLIPCFFPRSLFVFTAS